MIEKVKCFVHHKVLEDSMVYAKRLEDLEHIEHYDIGLYGIIETDNGDNLFHIDFRYDGEPYVWKRFMHVKSFLGFYRHRGMEFMDSYSEKLIKSYLDEYDKKNKNL